jgi:ABC-2 type transport system ATP-binding protein
MKSAVIEVSGLVKSFESVRALDGISFAVERNEIFGFAGPDGAGKTTTIRILCGLIQADSGTIHVLGYDLRTEINRIRREIGYLSQRFSLYPDLSIDENIEFFAEIHGVKDYHKRRNELLEFTRLVPFRKRTAGKLSGGMKQKLSLACTLVHTPKIIFLDEPTTGVDPVSRIEFWKILSGLKKDGVTIIISTPYLNEAERFSKIALINQGRIPACGTPEEIKSAFRKQIIEIICSDIRRAYTVMKNNTSYELQIFGDHLDVAVDNYEKDYMTIKNILEEQNIPVSSHRLKPPSLENVFMGLMESIPTAETRRRKEGI